jgi:hypothetical protein
VFNINEVGANVAQFSLQVDGAQVEFQSVQVPPELAVQDGEVFSFVSLVGPLDPGAHTVDVLINSGGGGGITSVANSGALFFQVQSA